MEEVKISVDQKIELMKLATSAAAIKIPGLAGTNHIAPLIEGIYVEMVRLVRELPPVK